MAKKEKYQKEYGLRVSNALEFYGLSTTDLAHLIDASSANINDIIKGKVGLSISKMIDIAKVFGMKYYDFANPKVSLLDSSTLPSSTQKKIKERDQKGFLKRDNRNLLATELDKLIGINGGVLKTPKTSKQLLALMSIKVRNRNSSEITNLLNKEPRKSYILKLDHKYGRQSIFIHKDYLLQYSKMTHEEIMKLIDQDNQ